MCAASIPQEESVPVGKPSGGYQLIPAVHLALAWWCYRQKLIRLVDLRVWFAAWEMRARRCRRPASLPRRFGLEELAGLTGLSPRRLRDSRSAGSRRRGCWAGRSRRWNFRPRPGPSPCPTATLSGGSWTEFPTMTAWCQSPAAR